MSPRDKGALQGRYDVRVTTLPLAIDGDGKGKITRPSTHHLQELE
jgi:hypothetical protein